MACIFGLLAEFGNNEKAAEEFSNHFSGLKLTLSDGLAVDNFTVSVYGWPYDSTDKSLFGCYIIENGVTYGDYVDPSRRTNKLLIETPGQLTECGFLLLDRLKTSPPFRCASVGWERPLHRKTWLDILRRDSTNAHGLVIHNDLLQEFNGFSSLFVPFANGYSWIPYRGNDWYS